MKNRRIWTENDSRPNIILILVEQWRGDCLSVAGHPTVETPNIDELAHRGVLFNAAYSACPTCITARANLWTGRSPSDLGWLGFPSRIPWTFETTLPHELKTAGYQTACIGKTHFSPPGARLGFEVLESYEGLRHTSDAINFVSDYEEWLAERTGGTIRQDDHGLQDSSWVARPSHLPEELHNNTWMITRGIEFLRRRDRTRPFFLNLSFHRPHAPLDPPQAYFDMVKDAPLEPVPIGDWVGDHDRPATGVNSKYAHLPDKWVDRARRAYYAQMAHIDVQIGRLVMRMIHMGLINNTWIIFTADHGEMMGDHYQFKKGSALEGSARIPLIIAPPRGIHQDGLVRNDAPVSLFDLMPTVLDIVGESTPDSCDGRSLSPFLSGDRTAPDWREYIHGEHSYANDDAMQYVTDGKEKFIWNTLSGRERFFDLREDPGETRNLAADPARAERVDRWRNRLIKELEPRVEDGLTDGKALLPGKTLPIVRDER